MLGIKAEGSDLIDFDYLLMLEEMKAQGLITEDSDETLEEKKNKIIELLEKRRKKLE